MKRIVILTVLSLGMSQLSAQTDFETYKRQQQQKFGAYSQQQKEEFEAYRAKLNAEYAEFMRKAWTACSASPAKPLPKSTEPVKPATVDPAQTEGLELLIERLTLGRIFASKQPAPPVEPAIPLPEAKPVVESSSGHTFTFYGTKCEVGLTEAHRFTLKSCMERDAADGWKILANERYIDIVSQCMQYRNTLRLCDWGYVRFLQEMTESFFTAEHQDEAVLMQMYVLVQSGYKVRMARVNNRLVLLLPMMNDIYNYSYVTMNNEHYFIIAKIEAGDEIYVYNKKFPQEQQFSLLMNEVPLLANESTDQRTLTSRKLLSATVATNKNLIDYYNDYPKSSEWNYYSITSLSPGMKKTLYPALQQAIAGKSKAEAANLLLNFVQTSLDYQTDDEQFGGERAFFADETLFYPYCDCEDRSILYSILVRDLLGLDVVLLHYPGHLATAVCFDENVSGDHLLINGAKYLVCDPTYIGADIGMCIPKYKKTSVDVVRIAN